MRLLKNLRGIIHSLSLTRTNQVYKMHAILFDKVHEHQGKLEDIITSSRK